VQDIERGVLKGISEHPWQIDTSIGDWFYNRDWKYRPLKWVIHMLVDVVSKNGNLLINVVQRPDGTLDAEVEQMLAQMADWIAVNGEAVYGTRPWTIFGEGPVRAEGGAFKEDVAFTAEDVRFTTKGETLYAFVLGWPKESITIHALGASAGRVTGVRLLGYGGTLEWSQNAEDGLKIRLPASAPCDHAVAFAISGVVKPADRTER
jgi:alpha-L-fucosidase